MSALHAVPVPPAELPASLGLKARAWQWEQIGIGESGDRVYRLTGSAGAPRFVKISARRQDLLRDERDRLAWMHGRLPVPEILGYAEENGVEHLVTTEIPGQEACDPDLGLPPKEVVRLLAEGLRRIHELDVSSCPFIDVLDIQIPRAVAVSWAKGPEGAAVADELLSRPRPVERPVFTHGDYCEPNILICDGVISGFIDVGYASVADPYRDYGQMMFSFNRNHHTDLKSWFFDQYGLATVDQVKLKYFQDLEMLF